MGNVAIFVDYENIHISLHRHFKTTNFDYAMLPKEIRKIGQEYGKIVFAKAYADWTTRTKAIITAFGMNLIECKHVFPKVSGADRSDIAVAIEAMELLFMREDIETFIIFSGDSDFRELAIKIESRGKNIIVCGFDCTTSEELKKAASYNFIPLEERLKLERIELITPPSPSSINWKPLIERISRLSWNFIGWSSFRNKYLEGLYPSINWDDLGTKDKTGNQDDFLELAVSEGIIERYIAKHENQDVTAIKLNVNNEIVKQVLSSS